MPCGWYRSQGIIGLDLAFNATPVNTDADNNCIQLLHNARNAQNLLQYLHKGAYSFMATIVNLPVRIKFRRRLSLTIIITRPRYVKLLRHPGVSRRRFVTLCHRFVAVDIVAKIEHVELGRLCRKSVIFVARMSNVLSTLSPVCTGPKAAQS